jgi:acyl-coenzyme A synthetase/AMP-(fatty) acid ligase
VVVSQVVASIREIIGPIAAFKVAVVMDRLPKTKSGKILRGTIARGVLRAWKIGISGTPIASSGQR